MSFFSRVLVNSKDLSFFFLKLFFLFELKYKRLLEENEESIMENRFHPTNNKFLHQGFVVHSELATLENEAKKNSHHFKTEIDQLKKKKILIIDDQQDFRLWLAETLSDHHFHVFTARNAEQALESLWYERNLPELILVDYKLPQMSGKDFIKFMKIDYELNSIPIIMMSGYLCLDDQEFLAKPFREEDLIYLINKKLNIGFEQ